MFGWFRKKTDKEFDSKLSELKQRLDLLEKRIEVLRKESKASKKRLDSLASRIFELEILNSKPSDNQPLIKTKDFNKLVDSVFEAATKDLERKK